MGRTRALSCTTTRAPDGLARLELAEVEQYRQHVGLPGVAAKLVVVADVAAIPPVEIDLDGWWWLPADVAAARPDSSYERVPKHLVEGDLDWSVGSVLLPTELAPGEEVDLGTVRLAPVPVVAAGRVCDGACRPVAGARLYFVERFGPLPDHRWHDLARVDTDSDGRFRLRGVRSPRALGVRVEAAGFAPSGVGELVPGDRSIEIALQPAEPPPPQGRLALKVLVDQPALSRQMRLRIERQGRGGRSPDWFGGRRMVVFGLAPGTHDVWVETRRGGLRIGGVDDIAVKAGECTEDPRLLPLDLRGAVRWVALEVARPDGTPWRRQPVRIDPRVPRSSFEVVTDDEGRAGFALPSAIPRVRVGLDAEHLVEVPIAVGAESALRVELDDG